MADLCSIEDCDKITVGRGWCNKHYRRWLHYGDPLFVKQIKGNDALRFWNNVKVNADGCWLWTGLLSDKGYSQFYAGGRNTSGYRWAYLNLKGPISAGLELDHLCRVHACVNPDHLEPVTGQENVIRGWKARGRPTHCKYGHPFNTTNTYVVPTSGRHQCRICRKERNRQSDLRRRPVNATAN